MSASSLYPNPYSHPSVKVYGSVLQRTNRLQPIPPEFMKRFNHIHAQKKGGPVEDPKYHNIIKAIDVMTPLIELTRFYNPNLRDEIYRVPLRKRLTDVSKPLFSLQMDQSWTKLQESKEVGDKDMTSLIEAIDRIDYYSKNAASNLPSTLTNDFVSHLHTDATTIQKILKKFLTEYKERNNIENRFNRIGKETRAIENARHANLHKGENANSSWASAALDSRQRPSASKGGKRTRRHRKQRTQRKQRKQRTYRN